MVNLEKRDKLKLFGLGAVGVLAMSLIPKKTEALLFKDKDTQNDVLNLKDGLIDFKGNRIQNVTTPVSNTDVATKGYVDSMSTGGVTIELSDWDDTTLPSYYGYLDADGNWRIKKIGSDNTIKYAKGTTNYTTNWTNRAGLSYDYYDGVF